MSSFCSGFKFYCTRLAKDDTGSHSLRVKSHSHERQRLRLHLRLHQIANIASMGCIKCKEEWVLHPFFVFDAMSSLTQCYHLDANTHADANVDARVNGP